MFYFILFTIFAAGWHWAGKEDRARKRKKARQDALWKLAGIKEIILSK